MQILIDQLIPMCTIGPQMKRRSIPLGIPNTGTSCYLNSLFQNLAALPDIIQQINSFIRLAPTDPPVHPNDHSQFLLSLFWSYHIAPSSFPTFQDYITLMRSIICKDSQETAYLMNGQNDPNEVVRQCFRGTKLIRDLFELSFMEITHCNDVFYKSPQYQNSFVGRRRPLGMNTRPKILRFAFFCFFSLSQFFLFGFISFFGFCVASSRTQDFVVEWGSKHPLPSDYKCSDPTCPKPNEQHHTRPKT